MRIKHHLSTNDYDGSLIEYLKYKNIKYQYVEFVKLVSFDVYEDQDVWVYVEPLISKYKMVDLESCEFSKKEIFSAERLYLWSRWYWDYPKPDIDGGYKSITYELGRDCSQCGVGKVQHAPFRVKGEPNWGARHVLRLYWIYDELFVKPEVYEKLSQAGIQGVEIEHVINHENGSELKTLKQIKIDTTLKSGFTTEPSTTVLKCNKCGKVKYLASTREPRAFQKDTFTNAPDFVKSDEYFGDGASANRLIIVSHRVFEVFEKEKWKGAVFEPLDLV